jgi:Phage integrase family
MGQLNDTVREVLRALPSRLKSARVFPSSTGETPLDAQNFYNRVFIPAVKEAGITGFTWHSLRHTFASRLVMANVGLRTVQELLGHQSATMTQRHAHLSPEHQLEAVRRLDTKRTSSATGTETESAPETSEAGHATKDAAKRNEWRRVESNHGPRDYETLALAI